LTSSLAKKFYSSVFGWEFQDNSQPDKYPPENIAFWHPPDRKSSPGGAISKTDNVNYTKLSTPNRGSAGLYLYVDDLEAYVKVSFMPTPFPLSLPLVSKLAVDCMGPLLEAVYPITLPNIPPIHFPAIITLTDSSFSAENLPGWRQKGWRCPSGRYGLTATL
jgi:hypothetical protein